MKRSRLVRHARLQRTRFRVRSRGATEKRARLKPMSAKRKALMPERTALLLGLKELVGYRCEFCRGLGCPRNPELDGHEVRKPRSRYWLDPEYVVILCRHCHEQCEAPYAKGRLEIPGTRSTGWGFAVVYHASKFTRNADALGGTVHGRDESGATNNRRREA